MHDPTRPDIEERHAQAIESDDLMVLLKRCSVDYLVAAGWVRDGLGADLFRLRVEFDNARADLLQAQRNAADGARAANNLERHATAGAAKAAAEGDAKKAAAMRRDTERARDNAKALREATEAAALTARNMILIHLKSLERTSQALHTFAVAFGARSRFYNLDAIHAIVPRALQLWLDPNCPHCRGRGFSGGFGEPVRLCQECISTGKRINGNPGFRLARSDSGHEFGRALLVEMDRKTERVVQAMKLYLHSSRVPDEEWGEAQAQALRQRLADLRSTQAEID